MKRLQIDYTTKQAKTAKGPYNWNPEIPIYCEDCNEEVGECRCGSGIGFCQECLREVFTKDDAVTRITRTAGRENDEEGEMICSKCAYEMESAWEWHRDNVRCEEVY